MNNTLKHLSQTIYTNRTWNDHELNNILFNAIDSIFVTDQHGRILIASEKTVLDLGVPLEELLGSTIQDLINRGVYSRSTALECMETKEKREGLLRSTSGNYFFSTSRPVFDSDGELAYVVTNTRDHDLLQEFCNELEKDLQKQREYNAMLNYLQREITGMDQVIFESPTMKKICAISATVATSDSTVLLTGETGTGKGVFAKMIYRLGKRRDEIFLPVNCASIPPELMESELFGYEKGAFTGASNKGHMGLLEMANNGTLFLDEIGELPLPLQPKILRFLEEGEIRRVGGNETIHLNVRVIAATNRNLMEMVQAGKFREDLYYRLNIIPIELPPLRERKEDIIPLAQHYLEDQNQKMNKNAVLTSEEKVRLLHYSWPGNIRELRNIIERFVVTDGLSDSLPACQPAPAPAGKKSAQEKQTPAGQPQEKHSPPPGSLSAARDQFERDYIQNAIRFCNGNVTKAAKLLGIHRTMIYKKLGK